MPRIQISFQDHAVQLSDGSALFPRRHTMRFELFALLAFRRVMLANDQAWVTIKDIERLPSWRGRPAHHIATNVGRYLQARSLKALVDAKATWGGPYRLAIDSLLISFDIPISEVRTRLLIRPGALTPISHNEILDFTRSYARAQWLFFRGQLLRGGSRSATNEDAYERLLRMSDEPRYGSTLQLLASLSAVDVLYRIGRFQVARKTLMEKSRLLKRSPDLSLKARFYLSLAWAHQRSSTGRDSDRAVERTLAKAGPLAENSGDRAAIGQLAYRRGGFLTKKVRYPEAVTSYLQAVESFLITGNFNGVQSACGDLGSVIHRRGPDHYAHARRWLLTSIGIARLMRIGREDAHAEMILGKMYVELDKKLLSRLLLQRAERIARRARNTVNLADTKMVWAFWFQRYGSRKQQVDTLVSAVRLFRGMSEFDVPQKEKYMGTKFADVWPDVVASL